MVTIVDPGVKVDEGYAVYTEGRERGLFCQTLRRRRVPQRRLAGRVRVPRLHEPATRARGGATTTARCSTPAWPASGATWTSRRCSSRASRRCPRTSCTPAKAEPRLHGAGPQPLRLADGARRARGARAAAARPAPVRHHARGLRRPPAPRAAVDGRQQLVVGAPVDGDARSCRTSGCRAWRSAASTSAASTATRDRRAAGALDRARHRPAVLPQPLAHELGAAGAVGFGEPWTGLIRKLLRAADAAAAVPVRRVRGVLAHRRADPAAAAVRPPRRTRRPTPPTTSSCSATRCSWRRSRGRASSTATSTCRAGTWVHWWSGERDRRAGARARPRAARAAGALRARERGDPAVAGACRARPPGRRPSCGCGSPARRARGRTSASSTRTPARASATSARRSVRCDGTRIELGERARRLRAAGARGDRARAARRGAGHERARRRRAGRGARGGRRAGGGAQESRRARVESTRRARHLAPSGAYRPRPCRSRPAATASSSGWCRSRRRRRRRRRCPPSAPTRAAAAPRGR